MGKRAAPKTATADAIPTKKACLEKANEPSYDAFIVDNDDEFSALAWYLLIQQQTQQQTQQHTRQQKAGQGQRLSVIQSLENLHQGGLTQELKIDANGIPQRNEGLLFSDTSMTLLIDFRQFSPEHIPELNELFEKPARLDGRELGSNVRIVTVISPQMLPTSDSQQDSPGPDFWWRINGTCPPQSISDIITTNQDTEQADNDSLKAWLDQNITELDNSLEPELDSSLEPMDTGSAGKIVDFTGREDWHGLLFGTPGVDEHGQLIHQPGALEGLESGQTLILKNAPWQDQAFAVQLAQTFRSGTFRCNGSNAQLPQNLKLYRQPLSQEEIKAMAQSIHWDEAAATSGSATQAVALINKDNFAQIMHENVLTAEGRICRRDMLAVWLKGCHSIRITSPLTQNQWLQLVSRLQEAKLQHLPFSTDVPEAQPPFFRGGVTGIGPIAKPMTFMASEGSASQVSIEWCDGNSQLPLNASGSKQEFVILPEQSLTKIAQRTEIVSLQNREFRCSLTYLVKCLRDGTPVCLSGLQSNPVLLRQLETLLCTPPHLVLLGQREEFPNMKLTITWPRDREMLSPVWQAFAPLFAKGVTGGQAVETDGEKMDTDSSKHQAFAAFRRLYGILDRLHMATYCPALPPGDIRQLFQKVLEQAESEQAMDGCESLLPCHYHQAVNSVVLKEYRANSEVYSYLKHLSAALFLSGDPVDWVDQEHLQKWLAQHSLFDRETVKQQFWSLARAFPAKMFPNQQIPEDKAVDDLAAMLIILAAGDNTDLRRQGQEFAKLTDAALLAAEQKLDGLYNRSLHREKTFYNRLICLDDKQRQRGIIREQARSLADAELRGEVVFESALDKVLSKESRGSTELRQRLKAKQHDWQSWEQRRIKRLAEKVRLNPVVCIKGETGAGKSYIAEAVARTLNPDQPPQIITVGPETELSDLLGRLVLKPADASMVTCSGEIADEVNDPPGDTDLHTELLPTPLTRWAEKSSDKPVVLIIDEANLATPELWNCLKGLYDQPPCLHVHGEHIPVSPRHRIIMTGNPDHFSGRRMNELLRIKAPQLYYKPLASSFIRAQVLLPGLTKTLAHVTGVDSGTLSDHLSDPLSDHVEQLVNTIELLYKHYQGLLPGRAFTPRDLTDLISRIQAALSENTVPVELTTEGLNGLAWLAFEDALGCEVSDQKQNEKKALKIWYGKQKPFNDSLTKAQQERFEQFYMEWLCDQGKRQSTGTRLNYTNASVVILMRRIWLEQKRSLHEKKTQTSHRGRHATAISGPAGRGKSALLDQQLTVMCIQAGQLPPKQINAGYSSWELLLQAVNEAKQDGYPLIISELNLLKSEEIEGLLNNAITGQAAPGFHLYTTVNPASFVGRHRFSPALKNRFTCLNISEYTDQDIGTIANTVLPYNLTTELREQVINWHLKLRHHLKQKKIPLQPAVADLQRLTHILAKEYPLAPPSSEQLQTIFARQYSLFLSAGKCTLNNLPELPDMAGDTLVLEAVMEQLVLAPNYTMLSQPVLATRVGGTKVIQARSVNHVTVPEILADPINLNEASKEAILAIALLAWEKKSQSRECPCAHDTLYSACYRLWQQNFIKENYGVYDVLPLTQEQQATLEHPDNLPLLDGVKILLSQAPSPRALELLWEKLRQAEAPSESMAVSEQHSKQKKAEIKRPEMVARVIDGQTKERATAYYVDQIFKDAPPREQRMEIWQLTVDGSRITQTTLPTGAHGCDVICPELLQQPVYVTGEKQYGVIKKTLSTDRFIELPGLYAHQTITQLCTEPAIPLDKMEIIRDRGTGQLLIRLKEQDSNAQSVVELHYVVKRQRTSTNTEDNLLASSNTPFNKLIDDALLKPFDQARPVALIETLAAWARGFKADKDISANTDASSLVAIISQKQGACRHRAWAIFAIAAARGVPVRLVTSDIHEWIEYSADRGRTWEKVDPGGTGTDSKIHIEKPAFKESVTGLMFPKQEQTVLLQDAKADPQRFADKMGTSREAVNRWIAREGKAPLEIDNVTSCYSKLLSSRSLSDLRKAVEMVKSGMINDDVLKQNKYFELFYAFAKALRRSSSEAEIESVLKLLYEMKNFVKATKEESATQNWYVLLDSVSTTLSQGSAIYGRKYREMISQKLFDFWSYGVLEENLLSDLAVNEIQDIYESFRWQLESLTEHQQNNTLPEVMAKFEERLKPYYPSIKAPVIKRLQAAPRSAATTEIKSSSSPSFEQRLKTTCIGSGFTWLPEGEVMLPRLLKQLPPFRVQKTSDTTRKVKLIQSRGAVIEGRYHEYTLQSALLGGDNFMQLFATEISLQFDASNQKDFCDLWRTITIDISVFIKQPTPIRMSKLKQLFESNGLKVTPGISGILDKALNLKDTLENAVRMLPSSFANYLEKQSKADRGNLGLYSLAENEDQRGYQLLTSKEAILEADSQKGKFLPLPVPLIKKHLQEEDSESLFVDSGELRKLIEEYIQQYIRHF